MGLRLSPGSELCNIQSRKGKRVSYVYSLLPEGAQLTCFSGEVEISVLDSKKSFRHKIPEAVCTAGRTVAAQSDPLEANGR